MESAPENKRSPIANYEYKVEQRAMKHREISHRNNTTTCRSPTRDLDTRQMKNELHLKRQSEFFKRRPVDHGTCSLLSPVPRRRYPRETLHATQHMTHTLTSIRRPLITSQNVKLQRDGITLAKQNEENELRSDVWEIPGLSSVQLRGKVKKERVLLKDITQLSNFQKTLQTASIQTESGFVTVKEADVNQLTDYLEEALQREEALKKKLSNLQKSAATLLHSTELLWKTRCDEDVLKSKIKALEAQLQVCIKKIPQDGVKRIVLKMEKQREEYEKKALKAIHRAENEKAEAQSRSEYLQGALQTSQSESQHWQRLCEELRESSSQMKKRQDESTDQMLQLQGHLERSVGQEEMLRKQSESLEQERVELHSCISELQEENLTLREYLQELTGNNHEGWNSSTETHEEVSVLDQLLRTDNSPARHLRDAEHRLRAKEKECMELQADLEALEQECYGYQSRLTQCREEMNSMATRQKKRRSGCCRSWLCMCVLLLILMAMVLAVLWFYHPPIREQLRHLYSELEERLEDYLILTASTRNRFCFRPV
ncbi:TRAF3-interacting JNK-activating modulator isoform X2 [Danio rerio]|uniref:TRAF3-interacting JNK-activating modulator isoform X2 n=1 Tax=Danio rerio TaxID=7955 RepID=A0AC58GA16_DANRE